MQYGILADLVITLHLAFIVYAMLGGFLGLWRKWCLFVHLPAVVWAALMEFQGWICPLTPLENRLRFAGGSEGYQGGFAEHYLVPIIYPQNLTIKTQWILGGIAVVANIGIYWFVVTRRRKPSRKRVKFARREV